MTHAAGADRHRTVATAIGFGAVVLWALLALFTVGAAGIPPFQLLAMTFTVAFAIGLAQSLRQGAAVVGMVRAFPGAIAFGTTGLFGYHLFYFIALGNAPAVDASLIAYLWPLLIVLLSGLMPGERLFGVHIIGGLMGFAGAAVITLGRGEVGFDPAYTVGYLAAAACAITWSSYSVFNRRFAGTPTLAVTPMCGLVAVLAAVCHLAVETTVTPDALQAAAALALGLGPVGAAFFLWDHGTKHGDLGLLGVSSYAAPLLSTLVLIAVGLADASWRVLLACGLIVGGAVLAATPTLRAMRTAGTGPS